MWVAHREAHPGRAEAEDKRRRNREQQREMLIAGKSDSEIKGYLVSRYSEFILFRPAYAWRNAWLWSLPVVLLLLGSFIAVRVIKQRARMVDNEDDADVIES